MEYRTEYDSLGQVNVPADKSWGAQTERSRQNFKIGTEKMPQEVIRAFAVLKAACAKANCDMGKLSERQRDGITAVCDDILSGKLWDEFPLSVWQTGSGTQTNMNLNEVIAHRANAAAGENILHPNDHVNSSQSSNDTFPSAMRIAFCTEITRSLLPAVNRLTGVLDNLCEQYSDVIKIGRTHLQDAVPLTLSQEISGWRAAISRDIAEITDSMRGLSALAIGGTAVGTGLGAPDCFDKAVARYVTDATGIAFTPSDNKFCSLTSLSDVAVAHGALRALACDLMKMANDIRLLSSGPRCGIGELNIPENEPGSSIMPGKVNPTQCEMVTMVAARVMGNDTTVSFAASQGNFQLNVFLPVTAYTFLQSVRLLADAAVSFTDNCVAGIKPNRAKIKENLDRSLMLVTALSGKIGYDNAAKVAKTAFAENLTLAKAAEKLGFMSEEEAKKALDPRQMIK